MYYKFFIYFIVCGSIFLIPQSIFEKIIEVSRNCAKFIINILKNTPFLEYIRGRDLLFSFSQIESMYHTGKINSDFLIHEYKFYGNLINRLISLSKSHGIALKKFLPEIKNALAIDVRFEQKITNEITNGLFQFTLVSIVTWGFVILSQSLVPISISKLYFVFMGLMQIFGIVLYLFVAFKIKLKFFKSYGYSLEEIYIFTTEFDMGLPLNKAINDSKILSGEFSQNKKFSDNFNYFINLLESLKNSGTPIIESLQLIIKNIWEDQANTFEKFHKYLNFIKFLHLALIYLPVYFLYLACIFKFFMEQ